ncbi:MAG TPA: hypothetical protein VGX23_02495 [Actinocrinis sp.]|nr:hypothetical protein [Actinocrinis sp.]
MSEPESAAPAAQPVPAPAPAAAPVAAPRGPFAQAGRIRPPRRTAPAPAPPAPIPPRPAAAPPTLRWALISILCGAAGLAAALGWDHGPDRVAPAIAAGALCAAAAMLAGFLVQVDRRVGRLELATGPVLREAVGQIRRETAEANAGLEQAVGELYGAVGEARGELDRRFAQLTNLPEAFGLQPLEHTGAAELVKMVRDAYAFERRASPLANTFARNQAQRLNSLLHQLRAGQCTYEGEDRDWLLALTGICTRTLYATSLTTTDAGGRLRFGGGFWETDLGLRYLELQGEATRRGVTVRRLFILQDARITADKFYNDLCLRHRKLGIDIRYLTPDMLSPDLLGLLDDFIIFDNEVVYETVTSLATDNSRPVIANVHLWLSRSHVGRRSGQYTRLWSAALPCADPDDLDEANEEPPTNSG